MFERSPSGSIAIERAMKAIGVVIDDIFTKQSSQMVLIEHDDVVEQFLA